jgi:hypothetical protein
MKKVESEDIIKLWFKYDCMKELVRVLGYAEHGALSRRAKSLGLPEWNRRMSYLWKQQTESVGNDRRRS